MWSGDFFMTGYGSDRGPIVVWNKKTAGKVFRTFGFQKNMHHIYHQPFFLAISSLKLVQLQFFAIQRKWGEMKQRLAWNSGKPYVQSYRPLSIFWHTLLATVSRPMLYSHTEWTTVRLLLLTSHELVENTTLPAKQGDGFIRSRTIVRAVCQFPVGHLVLPYAKAMVHRW